MRTPHHRPTKGVLRTEALTSQHSSLSELDEVHAGERVVDLLHRRSEQLGKVRTRLIEKGLLYAPTYGRAAFTVPQFDRFLRRSYPAP